MTYPIRNSDQLKETMMVKQTVRCPHKDNIKDCESCYKDFTTPYGSDQLNSEIDEILQNWKISAVGFYQTKAAIQTLINKARVEEVKNIQSELTYFAAQYSIPPKNYTLEYEDGKYLGQAEVTQNIFNKLNNRIAELSTQEERGEVT